MEKIFIGSDHAGFELKKIIKEFLIQKGHEVEDLGSFEYDKNDDYPNYAQKVCKKVLETSAKGILICDTGQGMCIAANKIPGIYAELCWNEETAKHAKEHGNVNVLCIGAKFVDEEKAKKLVKIWLETPFVPEKKHMRRINKIKEIEERYMKPK